MWCLFRLPLPLKWTRRSKVLAQKKRDVSPCIYHSLWRGVQNVILRPEYAVRWYFSNIHKHCGGHRVALVPIPTWYKWFQQIALLIQRNSCVHGWAPLYIKCSDLHQIVSRILAIRKDKTFAFAFEADNIVCWLVNPPIAKLDLFKSADCRWIYKSSAEYCYRNSATVRRLVQSPTLQSTFFFGCPSDLRGKA